MWIGSGVSNRSTCISVSPTPVSDTLAEALLSAGLGSVSAVETVPVAVLVPVVMAWTSMLMFAEAPFARLPSEQVTMVASKLKAQAGSGVTRIGMTPAGRLTVNDTLVAAAGPALLIVAE